MIVGGCLPVAYLLRLGWIADYFSRAVLVGYMHGVVVVLIVGQLGKLFGVSITEPEPIPQLVEFFGELDGSNGSPCWSAFASIAVLRACSASGSRRCPGALVVVIGGIVASAIFDLADHGVRVVGTIPPGLPSFAIPRAAFGDVVDLLPAALGIFAVGSPTAS